MCERSDARVVKSRDSFFTVLAEVISEDDYNLSIRSTDLCKKANKGRATFFRKYRQVGDIFRLKDEELLAEFRKIDFDGLSQKAIWRKVLLFMAKNREIFTFKFCYDRDKVFRKMVVSIKDKVAPTLACHEPELADKLFEMLYFEVRGIVKIWVRKGAKAENVNKAARCLAHASKNVSKHWVAVFDS